MDYEFYADVFFLTNFYLDFLAVYAVGEILAQKRRMRRYLVVSALGSMMGCVLFLALKSYDWYRFCIHLVVNPGMVWISFFPAGKKIYGTAFGLMYFVLLLLGGSVEWLFITVFGGNFYELSIILASVPLFLLLYILRRKRKNVQRYYRVVIFHGEIKTVLTALYDTGNSLLDPYIKEPVHIISKGLCRSIGGGEAFAVRLIPFSSVGCRSGMLEAFTVDGIRIETEEGEYEVSPAVLAAAEDEVFLNRPYQMILNCKSIEEKIEGKEETICT